MAFSQEESKTFFTKRRQGLKTYTYFRVWEALLDIYVSLVLTVQIHQGGEVKKEIHTDIIEDDKMYEKTDAVRPQ